MRMWFLQGPGLPETLISKKDWVRMHGNVCGWRPYVAEFKAELLISEMPSLPVWLLPVHVLRCAREAA